jgi:hypothetical protein
MYTTHTLVIAVEYIFITMTQERAPSVMQEKGDTYPFSHYASIVHHEYDLQG